MSTARLLVVGAILILVGGAALFLLPQAQQPEEVQQHIPGTEFVYRPGNFAITPNADWIQAEVSATSLPTGFLALKFAFKKEGTSCVLGYVDEPVQAPWRESYKQTTPGERVYLGKTQIDSWWWVPKGVLPDGFEPQFEGRLPFAGEVLVGTAGYVVPVSESRSSFVLYAEDGTTVPDECVSENTAILKTYRDAFERAVVGGSGLMRIIQSSMLGTSFLAFKADGDDTYKKIESGTMSYESNVVFDDKVYTIRDGRLVVINPFPESVSPFPGIETSASRTVLRFYIDGEHLWYLLGAPGCVDYMARCDLALYEINARGGRPVLLAETMHLESGSIVGYDPNQRILYVRSSFGDAGAYHYTIYAYSYETGAVTEILEDGGSADDPPAEHAEANAKLKEIQDSVGLPLDIHEFVRVQNGSLSKPDFESPMTSAASFVFPR
jgi:hypothetical protein